MVLHLNTLSGMLATDIAGQVPLTSITVKRGTDFDLYIVPSEDIPITSTGVFVAVFPGQTQPVISAAWLPPSDQSTGWLIEIPLRGAQFANLFLAAPEALLDAELTVVLSGKVRKSQTIQFRIQSEVYEQTTP